ncbi:DUF58 domain-containing protein [Roseiconus nitratireducens]|uniref:DUF58 domain-containing protein n=1 Tax=Roseiconus nitratireducens TaxID=2605748 RepID=A0A5M6DI83_9BACT|nr:DUF58 domain-containing protein [Roseiconus nitratireducens]KAA5547287.1 DUF58 domain-containing protein [Roseiconus nitratireducens]
MTGRVTVQFHEMLLLKADARGFSLLPRQPVGSLLAGRHASRLRGRGLSFEELRHYHQGDDIRSMDWKATARLRSPHVRVYTEERERPVLLIVDQRESMFFGSRRAMKSVAAAELAALAAWRALDAGDRVGGLVFNNEVIAEVRPHRSQSRVLELFHEIERLNHRLADSEPIGGEVSINASLESAVRIAKHDHLVILISDLTGADEQTQRLATQLAAHNDVLVAAIYDPLGISLSGAPGMLASDRGQIWEISDHPDFEKDFQTAFQNRLDTWREIFRRLRVPVMPVSAARPVPDQIRLLFGSRAH